MLIASLILNALLLAAALLLWRMLAEADKHREWFHRERRDQVDDGDIDRRQRRGGWHPVINRQTGRRIPGVYSLHRPPEDGSEANENEQTNDA